MPHGGAITSASGKTQTNFHFSLRCLKTARREKVGGGHTEGGRPYRVREALQSERIPQPPGLKGGPLWVSRSEEIYSGLGRQRKMLPF